MPQPVSTSTFGTADGPKRGARASGIGVLIAMLLLGGWQASNATAAGKPSSAAAPPPLVLQSVGSFMVSGRTVVETEVEAGLYGGGPVVVDQMYVQYMIPRAPTDLAIVLVHGSTLSGKSFETTPDGRMGWYEYFVRKGFPTYVVDQVGRGRSGFNQAQFNDVRAGLVPAGSQPVIRRAVENIAWTRFRFGPSNGVPFEDGRFPTDAIGQLAMQGIPDLAPDTASDEANYAALAGLTRKLHRSVLLGHSQAGRFPFETALRSPEGIAGLIAIEPAGCNATNYSDEQIASLSRLPILIVFGDHLAMHQPVGPSWLPFFADCQTFVKRINAAHGRATMLHTADLGIYGNSHMMMQDRNNLQVANLIIKWIADKAR